MLKTNACQTFQTFINKKKRLKTNILYSPSSQLSAIKKKEKKRKKIIKVCGCNMTNSVQILLQCTACVHKYLHVPVWTGWRLLPLMAGSPSWGLHSNAPHYQLIMAGNIVMPPWLGLISSWQQGWEMEWTLASLHLRSSTGMGTRKEAEKVARERKNLHLCRFN